MEKKSVSKSVVAKFLERASVQIVNFVVGLVLARLLSPDDYGVYGILLIFINIGQTLVQGGFASALIQKKNTDQTDYSTVFVFSLVIAALVYMLLFVAAPLVGMAYKTELLIAPLRMIALVLFPSTLASVVNARISKTMDFGFLAKYSSVCVLMTGGIGILLASMGAGIWALVVQQILSFSLFPMVYCIRKHWFPGFRYDRGRLKHLLGFGIRVMVTDLVNSIYVDIQGLIIGMKYSTETLAYFNRGQIFPNTLMTTLNSTVATVLFPVYADIQDRREQMRDALLHSLQVITFVVYPLLLGLLAVADLTVDVLLTDKWSMCIPFIQIYCIAYLFWPLDSINLQVIKACGAGRVYLYQNLLKKGISSLVLVAFTLGAPSVEIFALSAILIYVFDITVGTIAAKKLIPITLGGVLKAIWRNLLCSCGVLTVALLPRVFQSSVLELALRVLVGGVIYVILSLLINRDTMKTVLNILLRLLGKKKEV